MLTIKEFVKQTVMDLQEVQDEVKSINGIRGVIDFDIAVVAVESGEAGVKLGVWGVGGKFGGSLGNQVTSRVRFCIQTKGAISPGELHRKGR